MATSDMQKKYKVRQFSEDLKAKVPKESIEKADLLHTLLYLRDIPETEKDNFLKPDFETGLHDPFLLKKMDITVERILKAIKNNEHILVYSDFDADGLPGSAVFHDFFRKISYPNVSYFRPDRHNEGFGLHAHILNEERFQTVSLVVTIDCGIADVLPAAEIYKNASARNQPIDIIITDHHLPGPELPKVYAIVNPKQEDCNYPEKMLCGAAVIYKVVCALVATMRKEHEEKEKGASDGVAEADVFGAGYEKWLLDLVGLSTLSDMVPLRGENRLLAYYGLIVMRKTKRPGFLALAKTNMINLRNITEDDIVFTFSPRINVASRLADAGIAFELLTTDSYDRASDLAKELHSINTKRKTMVAQITKQAHSQIKDKNLADRHVLVIGNPDWKPPVLGLVATSLIKTYRKPAFVWGRSDDGAYKGSVRGYGGIDITKIMHHMEDEIFINRGGHAEAGGFTVAPDHIFEFENTINKAFEELYLTEQKVDSEEQSADEILHEVDAELTLSSLQNMTMICLEKLAPYGMANPKPVFAFPNCTITRANMFGKQKDHLELHVTDTSLDHLRTIKGIQFFYENDNVDEFTGIEAIDKKYTIIGHIEKNQFMGASDIRLRLIDVWESGN